MPCNCADENLPGCGAVARIMEPTPTKDAALKAKVLVQLWGPVFMLGAPLWIRSASRRAQCASHLHASGSCVLLCSESVVHVHFKPVHGDVPPVCESLAAYISEV